MQEHWLVRLGDSSFHLGHKSEVFQLLSCRDLVGSSGRLPQQLCDVLVVVGGFPRSLKNIVLALLALVSL